MVNIVVMCRRDGCSRGDGDMGAAMTEVRLQRIGVCLEIGGSTLVWPLACRRRYQRVSVVITF